MATAYASHSKNSVQTGGGTEGLTFTKPTGLAAGDLMVLILFANGQTLSLTPSDPPSGWVSVGGGSDASNSQVAVYTRVATSGDAAATDFSFSFSTANDNCILGFLIRVTGTAGFAGLANIEVDVTRDGPGTSHTFSGGVTPRAVGSLLLFAMCSRGNVTHSAYAITNNNPSWTEQDDFASTGDENTSASFATGAASAIAATGDYTATTSGSVEAYGILLSILESTNISIDLDVVDLAATPQEPTVTGTAIATIAAPVEISLVPQSPAIPDSGSEEWTYVGKPTDPTWTPVPKP